MSEIDIPSVLETAGMPRKIIGSFSQSYYSIDLNNRTVNTPTILGVQNDHQANIVYFSCQRNFKGIDLANTIIFIYYTLTNGEKNIYIIPYIFIDGNDNIYIPWEISAQVTKQAGTVTFAFNFFKTEEENNESRLIFSLNTLSASSRILPGIIPNFNDEDYRIIDDFPDEDTEVQINKILLEDELWSRLQELIQNSNNNASQWNTLPENNSP